MAALLPRAAVFLVLVFTFVCFVDADTRYGRPSRYIGVARKKRSEPIVVSGAEDKVGANTQEGPKAFVSDSAHASVRNKRDATGGGSSDDDKKPEVSKFALNDSHQLVMIDWVGEGSDVIICVTRDTEQSATSASNVLISYDYGKTYQNTTSKFKTKSGKSPIINKFYKNDKFTSRFVFTDVFNKYVYTTSNNGLSIASHKLVFTPSELVHHPIDPLVLLSFDTEDKEKKLWISEDFGETWRRIGIFVKSYYWSETTSPPTLFVEREEPSGLASVVSSAELFREDTPIKTVITDVEDFEVKDEFLFAIKKVHLLGSHTTDAHLQLWVSYRQGPFMNAEFPSTLPHQHYYIADISEGQVMVCVAHGDVMSNLYVSSVPRSSNHQLRFSLSMERILYFNPSTNWVDTWLSVVADKTFADLHPVEGIRGVFIASQLVENYTKSGTSLGPEHLTSYITFDQGGLWKPLQPPLADANGNTIQCLRKDNCSLHLSQELLQFYPAAQTKTILSKKSSPGLILATGTIGTSLKGHLALYLSTDAGISWYQQLFGSYIYTIGDHGGIIVAAQMYQANGTSNEIHYSIDEGETWQTHQFNDEKIRIYGLMTEPGENTTIFTIFGSESEKHQWIFIKVDMRPVFERACNATDYKTWSPTDTRRGHNCLLGRKQVYERRGTHVRCYNGIDYDRPISVENCPCGREDFECDFGFRVKEETLDCVDDPTDSIDPFAIPATCQPWSIYNRTKGYRKIPGDSCEGGREYQFHPAVTACPVKDDQEFLLVSSRQDIMRYNLVNPEAGLEPLPIPGLRMVIALDFDMKNNTVYWSDVDEKKIKRFRFDGYHNVETLVETNLQSVEGLALDWVSNNLYFVDGERKTLEVLRTDLSHFGRMRRTLLSSPVLDNPRGIAVHPVHGFLYITDWSESNPMVASSYLDGTNLTVLFGVDVVGWPNGITIDFQTERIYFADAKLDFIASADLDGKNLKKIIVNSDKVLQPFALGIYKNLLFWDDWTVHQVLQADKEYGWGIMPISNFTKKGLVDLKVFGHWSQQGTNACGEGTNCTYLCLGRPNNKFSCLCPDGMKATKNGSIESCTCPDGSAIQDDGTCKAEHSTCEANFFQCDNSRCIPRQWVCDVDNDCGDNSDENEKACGRKPCEAPAWQCDNGHCIAPSWRCDHDNDCGDGSDEKDCTRVDCPDDTFQCRNGRCIHRSWKCDMENDCRDGHIGSDEENCTVTPKNGKCRGTEFTCSDGKCIPGSWRCDGDRDCVNGSDETDCTSIKCESWQFQCNSNQCIFKTWRCDGEEDCQDKSDEVGCGSVVPTTPEPLIPFTPISPENMNCTALMFHCKNTHCIPFWWRCDGLDDCGDASDEEDCDDGSRGNTTTAAPTTVAPAFACKKDQFACSDGTCIWESWVCDHDRDCHGGEDEANCHQNITCADLEGFTCRRSRGCIPSKNLCDGHEDCADGSDEEGCGTVAPDESECPAGYFSCDGGACLESFKMCDGNHNCKDLTDEQHCSGSSDKGYYVTDFKVLSLSNTSVSVSWKVNDNSTNNLEYLPSLIIQAMTGNPSAWQNYTWIKESQKTFSNLIPYTSYLLKVYVRASNDSKTFPPIKPLVFQTEIGVPSPPVEVTLIQEEDVVKVSWKPPVNPNGPVENYRVFVSPPTPPREVLVSGKATKLTIPASFLPSPCQMWVQAINLAYTSNSSDHANYTRKTVDSLVKVEVESVNASAAHLKWSPVHGVEAYVVSHTQPENEYQLGEVVKNTTDTEIIVDNLAPKTEYVFKVRASKDDMLGPANPIAVTTSGNPLTKVKGLHGEVVKEAGTIVKLTWSEPAYNGQKIKWEYRIIWGKSAGDLKHSLNVAKTTNTTHSIHGLEACEEYVIAVMVEGPIGVGPVEQIEVTTEADFLAPPKNLHAMMVNPTNTTMRITWEPSCPYTRNYSLLYELKITDIVKNQTSYFRLPSKKQLTQSHEVEVHYGGRYSVSVRTSSENGRYANPVYCVGPAIPPPYELTFNPSDESFFWRLAPKMPNKLLNESNTFVLYVSKNSNMSDSKTYPSTSPPFILDDMSPGVIYHAAVALKDPDGYLSPKSSPIVIEKPISSEIVLSQNSVVGVAVSVFLVVVALIAVVAILAVRHRRLARSFITFANTHYDRSQGTTLITTEHNLDEDDDSPMIRGFSDDEPMVIA